MAKVTKKIQKLRAIRPEALSLLFVMFSSAAWTLWTPGALDRFGTLKGTDFAQFYVAARLVVTGRIAQLYDWSVFSRELTSSVPGPEGLLYLSIYPPQLAVLLAPLGALPYLSALVVWTVLSIAMYVTAGVLVIRRVAPLSADPVSSLLILLSFPACAELLLFGQVSALGLLLVAGAWAAWRNGAEVLAGLLLGALAFKPQMLVVAGVLCLLLPAWRLTAGVAVGVSLEVLAAMLVGGTGVVGAYASALGRVLRNPASFEPKAEQIQSLRGLLTWLGDGRAGTAAFAVSALVVLVFAARVLRRIEPPDLRFAAAALAGALVNPHLYVYDLVILVVPLGIVAGWLVAEAEAGRPHRAAAVATRVLYWLPLVAPVLGVLRVQLTAPAMLWLLWALGAAAPARSTADPRSA